MTWNSGILTIQCLFSTLCPILTGSYQSHSCPGPWIKTEQDSIEIWSTDPFCFPCFLFLGYKLHPASLTWGPKRRFKQLLMGKGGIQKQEEQSNGGTALRQGPASYSRNMHNNILESFCRRGGPRWRMVTSGWAQDSWSLCCLTTNQWEESHTACNPHPKCCFLFLGPSDDHPVRPPVWPLSISSLTEGNSFQLKPFLIRVNAGFRHRIPQLRSGRERLLLC